jgi:hypothetical protein
VDIDEFWALIEYSAVGVADSDERTEKLTGALSGLPVGEMVEFDLHLERVRERADTWLMWGAAYQICDSLCSDDGFWYFQAWLIGLGRETFERIVADPDALTDVPAVQRLAGRGTDQWDDGEWPDWELLDYAASEAYERVTGEDQDAFEDLLGQAGSQSLASPSPRGQRWDFEDAAQNARRLPRISAMFPLSPLADRDARGKALFEDFLAESGQTEEEFFAALTQREKSD